MSIKKPSSIYYFIKGLFLKPDIEYLPREYTRGYDYEYDSAKLPLELKRNHSIEFSIPDKYFQENFFDLRFSNEKKLNVHIVILTGTGRYFRGKLKIYHDKIYDNIEV